MKKDICRRVRILLLDSVVGRLEPRSVVSASKLESSNQEADSERDGPITTHLSPPNNWTADWVSRGADYQLIRLYRHTHSLHRETTYNRLKSKESSKCSSPKRNSSRRKARFYFGRSGLRFGNYYREICQVTRHGQRILRNRNKTTKTVGKF